jgi:hypothetical protein
LQSRVSVRWAFRACVRKWRMAALRGFVCADTASNKCLPLVKTACLLLLEMRRKRQAANSFLRRSSSTEENFSFRRGPNRAASSVGGSAERRQCGGRRAWWQQRVRCASETCGDGSSNDCPTGVQHEASLLLEMAALAAGDARHSATTLICAGEQSTESTATEALSEKQQQQRRMKTRLDASSAAQDGGRRCTSVKSKNDGRRRLHSARHTDIAHIFSFCRTECEDGN